MNTATTPSKFDNDFGSPMPIKLCKQELSEGRGQCFQPVRIEKNKTYKSGYRVLDYCAGHMNRKYGKSKIPMEAPVVPLRNNNTIEEHGALQTDIINNLFGYRFDRRCYQLKNYSEVRYRAAHHRVNLIMGKAELWNCTDCGYIAQEWSYNLSGEHERVATNKENKGQRYSLDYNQYEPRCKKCHKAFDKEARA